MTLSQKLYSLPDVLIDAIGTRWPFSPVAIRVQVAIDRATRFRAEPVWMNEGSGYTTWQDRRGRVYGSDL